MESPPSYSQTSSPPSVPNSSRTLKLIVGKRSICLPRADSDKHEKCCDISQAEAYLDHARDFHAFSLTRLGWAIQHNAGAAAVERYLSSFDAKQVKSFFSAVVGGRVFMESFPILFFAVEQNSPEIVRVLCKAGADPNQKSLPKGFPPLAYAVLSAEYDLSDTTDTLIALLAEGADPVQLPSDM